MIVYKKAKVLKGRTQRARRRR